MQKTSALNAFIEESPYSDAVDIKKLRFIFSAIDHFVKSKSKDIKDLSILEVGCGTGGITFPLTTLGCYVTAFDIDQKKVAYLNALISDNKIKNLNVFAKNGLTFDDGNCYDVVIASEVFEHVHEPLVLARNIAKKMHVGSNLIVTVPNGFGPWELNNQLNPIRCLKRWNTLRRLFHKPLYVKDLGSIHCQFYTKKRLEKLLENVSLKLLWFEKSDSFLGTIPIFRKSRYWGMLDIRLADILPYRIASGWYFVFEMQNVMI